MKSTNPLILVYMFSALALAGCGGSSSKSNSSDKEDNFEIKDGEIVNDDGTKGAKSDYNNTGLETVYEMLTYEKVVIVDGDDKAISGNEVPFESKFSIVFEGIKNYTLKDGRAFPKFMLSVTGGNQPGGIVHNEDLFASNTGGFSEADASVLRGTITVGEPMKPEGEYVCSLQISDKNKPEAYIMATWIFKVK